MIDVAAAFAYLDEHASYDNTGRIESPSIDVDHRVLRGDGRPAARGAR